MAQDDETSGKPQPLPGHETQSDEMACPKCGRFVGAATKCPYCGAKVEKRMSLVAIRFLMGFVKRHDFKPFGWYRIVVGTIIIILLLTGHSLAMVD